MFCNKKGLTTTKSSAIMQSQPKVAIREVETTKGLKEHRIAAGLTQAALAEVMCVSPQAVGKWERGESYPAASQLPDLAKALSCTIDELYSREEESA